MRTLTLSVASREETTARVVAAFAGEPQGAQIAFASVDLLWRVVDPKRLAVLRAMTGAGALTIREVARRVGRDVKAVHGDVHALLDAGLVERTDDGRVVFPYEAVRVAFDLLPA
jgi:predicted transcriptional regulator